MSPSVTETKHESSSTYLFSKLVSYFVQVLRLQKGCRAPLLDPGLVEGMIVEREYRLHTLPALAFWNDAGAAFEAWARDKVMNDSISFAIGQRLRKQGLVCLPIWLSCTHSVEPILDSSFVDLVIKWLVVGCFDKD